MKVLTKLIAENPDMSGVYHSKLQEALRTNNDTFNRDNLQIVLAKCGVLLHDVDDQLEKIEVGKWSGFYPFEFLILNLILGGLVDPATLY